MGYKKQNVELRDECEKLETAYHEIIEQFTKMNQLQTDLIKITNNSDRSHVDVKNIDKLTDREIQRIDNDF